MSIKTFYEEALAEVEALAAKVKKGLMAAGAEAPKLAQAVAKDLPTVEAITALVVPAAKSAEQLGGTVLAKALQAIEDAGEAASANGVSVSLDATLVADLKALKALIDPPKAAA